MILIWKIWVKNYPDYNDKGDFELLDVYNKYKRYFDEGLIDEGNERSVNIKRIIEDRGLTVDGKIPDTKYTKRTISTSITRDRILRWDFFKLDINVKDGKSSKELIHNMKITIGKNGKQNGVEYKGKSYNIGG